MSALALLRAYEKAEKRCKMHPNNPAFVAEFGTFDPVIVETARLAVSRSRACAESLLKRIGGSYAAAPDALLDIDRFQSHGQMIDWRTAQAIGIPQVHPVGPAESALAAILAPVSTSEARLRSRACVFESRDLTILAQ